jgi:hypothetical protein
MPAPPTISKPPSLPSLSSSNITHSHSARTHFTAPSNTRAVVTAPRACTHISHPGSRTHFCLSQLGLRTNHHPPPTTMRSTGLVTEASLSPSHQTWRRVSGLPSMHSPARVTITIVPDGGLLCVPAKDPENTIGGDWTRWITTGHRQMIDNRGTSSVHVRDHPTNHRHPDRPTLPQLLSAPPGAKL